MKISNMFAVVMIGLLSGCAVFRLQVVNGTGSGTYKPLAVVPISADAPLPGTAFDVWSGDVSGIVNKEASSTSILMAQIDKTVTATYTNITPPIPPTPTWPMKLGAWGGRPSCALDANNRLHVVVDGNSSPKMAVYDIVGDKVTASILDANTWNPLTKQLFNPSQVITADGTQLVTAWWFAFEVEAGCTPYVLNRKLGQAWQALKVDPSPVDWEPATICYLGGNEAVDFGFNNDYYKLSTQSGSLVLGAHGNYASGGGGGGEKEARWTSTNGVMQVANSGCKKTGGGWYRNSISCSKAVMWGAYATYPSMGSDDTGHSSVAGDLKNQRVGYMCASWDTGLVYNIWDGSKMLYPADKLPVIDRGGYSGLYKYPMSMASCPDGGAYIVWTNAGKLYLGLIHADGKVDAWPLGSGSGGALCVGQDGIVHIVYNQGGFIMYRQWDPKSSIRFK